MKKLKNKCKEQNYFANFNQKCLQKIKPCLRLIRPISAHTGISDHGALNPIFLCLIDKTKSVISYFSANLTARLVAFFKQLTL